MSSTGQSSRKAPRRGRASQSRKQGRAAGRQPTKAELQAIEARRRATILTEDVIIVDEEPAQPVQPARSRRPSAARRPTERQRQPAIRAYLTKAQEYAYIRSDLRRLVFTAGPLLLLMLALLFVLER